ncbi:MAG TPA: CAP domain-containing protein [Bosea sp. (in: a-proteobacteria)]
MKLLPSRFALLALALLAAGCAGEPQRTTSVSQGATDRLAMVKLDPAEATRIFNAYRASQGLGPVRLDPTLTAMAQRQANAMAASNSLSHDAAGNFTARVQAAGLGGARVAENVGGGYYSTADAFAGWRASGGHDVNLRMAEATRFGIALAKNPQTQYRAWWALVVAGDGARRVEMPVGPVAYFGSNPQQPR